MSLKFIALMIALLSILPGCASHLPGTRASEISETAAKETPDLQVSVDYLDGASSKYYRAFVVSFMNNTDRWIHFTSLNMRFPSLKNQPTYLLGEDLATYMESVDRRNKIDRHNRELMLGSLALVGAAAAVGGRNADTQLAGMGLMASAATVSSVQSVLSSARRSEFHQALPDNHILKPFSVPPGLSMSRWVVIALKEGNFFEEMALDLSEREGGKKTYVVVDRRYQAFLTREQERPRDKKTYGSY